MKNIHNILKLQWLYNISSTHAARYNNAGVGDLQFERLLEGHADIFQDPTGKMANRVPRTLIFFDGMSYFWDKKEKNELIACLNLLAEHGFFVYNVSWTNELQATIISPDDIYNQHCTLSLAYTPDEIIASIPMLRTMPKSNLCFLTTDLIHVLLATAYPQQYTSELYVPLSISSCIKLDSMGISYDYCMHYLDKSSLGGNTFIDTVNKNTLSFYQGDFLYDKDKRITVLPKINNIELVDYSTSELDLLAKLLADAVFPAEGITLIIYDLPENDQLNKIECLLSGLKITSLVIHDSIETKTLPKFITTLREIKELTLETNNAHKQFIHCQQYFSQLETLTLRLNSSTDKKVLYEAFKKMRHLKNLTVSSSQLDNQMLSTLHLPLAEESFLPDIQSITLNGCIITKETHEALFIKSPPIIVSADRVSCFLDEEKEWISIDKMPSLCNSISLSEVFLNDNTKIKDEIEKLNQSNEEELYITVSLSKIDPLSITLPVNQHAFFVAKDFTLANDIDWILENLITLSSMPKTRILTIFSNSEIRSKFFDDKNYFFNSLESINILGCTSICGDFLASLLKNSPQVKILRIGSNVRIKLNEVTFNEWLNKLRLDQIECLSLHDSDDETHFVPEEKESFFSKPAKMVSALLTKTSKLKVLDISKRNDLGNFIIPMDIESLKVVLADSPNISFENSSNTQIHCINDYSDHALTQERVRKKDNRIYIPAFIKFDPELEIKTKYIFSKKNGQKISPNEHRINSYNNVNFQEGMFTKNDSPFTMSEEPLTDDYDCDDIITENVNLKAIFNALSEEDPNSTHILGEETLVLQRYAKIIPSYRPDEKMLYFSIQGMQRDVDYVLKKSGKIHCYHIRLLKDHYRKVDVMYILKVPSGASVKHLPTNADISKLVRAYQAINSTPLDLPDRPLTSSEIMSLFIEQKRGTCLQKTAAFFKEIKNSFPEVVVNININNSHAFVFIKEPDSSWVSCNLGGFSIKLIYDEKMPPSQPQQLKKQRPLNPAFLPTANENSRTLTQRLENILSSYSGENVLLTISNDYHIDEIQKIIREIAIRKEYPIYYIDSPEDIYCYTFEAYRDEDNKITIGTLGPNAPLARFLLKRHENQPLLLVNWNMFTPEQLIQYNNLIDDKRMADMILIPRNVTLIGLYNTQKLDAYKEQSFYRRFDHQIELKISDTDISTSRRTAVSATNNNLFVHVNLHNSTRWYNILVGRYHFTGEGIIFKPGPLLEALVNNKNLKISDPPISVREYLNFMDILLINRTISVAGVSYTVPVDFAIDEGPSFAVDSYINHDMLMIFQHDIDTPISQVYHVLNSMTFSKLFENHDINISGEGWLDTPQNQCVYLYLTEPLRECQWGELIEEAKKRNIKLHILCNSAVRLPIALKKYINSKKNEVMKVKTSTIYQTKAPLDIINQIRKSNSIVIDITDLSIGDLCGKILINQKLNISNFRKTSGLISDLIKQNKQVILTGNIKNSVLQYICHFIHTNPDLAAFITFVTKQPLDALKPFALYHAVDKISPTPTSSPLTPIFNRHEANTGEFIERRSLLIHEAFQASPIVLIEGPTGAGKTTFILDHFSHEKNVRLYSGLSFMLSWLTTIPDDDRDIVLFIDEANISGNEIQHWTNFASMLLNDPPYVFYDNKYYIITPKHKVIFACNPKSYGGERHQPELFENYPIACIHFNALPDSVLITDVLKPKLWDNPNQDKIIAVMLAAYHQIVALSDGEPWISARELEHMVHLYFINKNDDAKSCANIVARHLLPDHYHSEVEQYSREILIPKRYNKLKGYLMTASHRAAESRINEFIHIRDYQRQGLCLGGLGGCILEGPPGCGKSEQLIAQLIASGFVENQDFYHVSITMEFDQKKKLLEDCYRNGNIVVIDEVNASPAMEKFFNDALTGKLVVMGPIRPGFLFFGTQNPVTMEGHRELSFAIRRRILLCSVPAYSASEMVEILNQVYSVPKIIAQEIVKDFETANEGRSSPLSFGTVIKQHKKAIEHIRQHANLYLDGMTHEHAQEFHEALFQSSSRDQQATVTKLLKFSAHSLQSGESSSNQKIKRDP